jgi:hypothetical protein
MKAENMPVAFLAALNSKANTYRARIARYQEYIKRDLELVEKNPGKYSNRLKNHRDKLARQQQNLAAIEEKLAELKA